MQYQQILRYQQQLISSYLQLTGSFEAVTDASSQGVCNSSIRRTSACFRFEAVPESHDNCFSAPLQLLSVAVAGGSYTGYLYPDSSDWWCLGGFGTRLALIAAFDSTTITLPPFLGHLGRKKYPVLVIYLCPCGSCIWP